MTSYASIADIGETLITLLREGLRDLVSKPEEDIILFSPGEIDPARPPRICLFLYHVAESAFLKNREPSRAGEGTLRRPGIFLDLHYMLIPYGSTTVPDLTDRTRRDHEVLGRAMQLFHDNAILRDPVLKGSLVGQGLEIRLTPDPVSLDELTRIWNAFRTKPFKPAVCYVVSAVAIESEITFPTVRVKEARM